MINETKQSLEARFGETMVMAIRNYIDHHIEPGSFLSAVISNNLKEAVGRADNKNIRLLPEYVFYFYNYAPSVCWGSTEKMDRWLTPPEEEP